MAPPPCVILTSWFGQVSEEAVLLCSYLAQCDHHGSLGVMMADGASMAAQLANHEERKLEQLKV